MGKFNRLRSDMREEIKIVKNEVFWFSTGILPYKKKIISKTLYKWDTKYVDTSSNEYCHILDM